MAVKPVKSVIGIEHIMEAYDTGSFSGFGVFGLSYSHVKKSLQEFNEKTTAFYKGKTNYRRLLFFSDLHLHHWQRGVAKKGSRLEDTLKSLSLMSVIYKLAGASDVFFLGDFTEAKSMYDASVIISGIECFRQAFNDIPVYVLEGNHDARYVNGDSRLGLTYTLGSAIPKGVSLCGHSPLGVQMPEAHTRHGLCPKLNFYALPYGCHGAMAATIFGANAERELPEATFVISHVPFSGAVFPNGITDRGGALKVYIDAFMERTNAPLLLQGHYHSPYRFSAGEKSLYKYTGLVVGSPIQHDWSDIDSPDNRGAMIVDAFFDKDNRYYKLICHRIVLAGFPRFFSTDGAARVDIDFVRYKGESSKEKVLDITSSNNVYLRTDYEKALTAHVRSELGISEMVPLGPKHKRLIDTGLQFIR